MKPVYLEFCGINSFSEKAVISFDRLMKSGIFGIFGDTGSGKSTILDAINFALYGTIERIKKSNSQIINYNCDEAYVVFEFEMEELVRHRYRIERSIKKKSGLQKAELYVYGEDAFTGICDGVENTNKKIQEIIGLGYEDFKRCIALPQGEFAQFIKSTPSERMKLIARLFDLEEKGLPLSQEVNRRYNGAKDAYTLLQGKLGEYAEINEEAHGALQSSHREAKAAAQAAEKRQALAETAFLQAKEGYQKYLQQENLTRRRAELEKQLPSMQEKRSAIPRLQAAAALYETAKRCAELQERLQRETQNLEEERRAFLQEEEFLLGVQKEGAAFEQSGALSESDRLLAQAELLLGDIEKRMKLNAELTRLRSKYKTYRQEYASAAADCERELARIRNELEAYGAGDSLYEYLKLNFKTSAVSEEYAAFCEDLRALERRHPDLSEDIQPLILKYTRSFTPFDFESASEAFKKKSALRLELEKWQSKQNNLPTQKAHCDEVLANGNRIKEEISRIEENLKVVFHSEDIAAEHRAMQRQNARLHAEKKRLDDAVSEASKRVSAREASISAKNAAVGLLTSERKETQQKLADMLQKSGFQTLQEARSLLDFYGDVAALQRDTDEFFTAYQSCREQLERLEQSELFAVTEESYRAAEAEKQTAAAAAQEATKTLSAVFTTLQNFEKQLEKRRAYEAEFVKLKRQYELLERLKKLLDGNKFMEFIAVEYLREISVHASRLLLGLTNNRYFLEYNDSFFIGDNLNGGTLRAANTLSGGETFLVSLSLALALSTVIYQKSLKPIEFFFLDEGFGTLDEKLLDTVMDTLEHLHNAHFSIGIITHVEELKHRIETKLLVTGATETRGSQVRMVE